MRKCLHLTFVTRRFFQRDLHPEIPLLHEQIEAVNSIELAHQKAFWPTPFKMVGFLANLRVRSIPSTGNSRTSITSLLLTNG